MRKHKRYGLVVLSMMWLILLVFCPTLIVNAEAEGYSDGYENGISLSTVVPPAVKSVSDAEYIKGSNEGLTFTTDDTVKAFRRVLIDEIELSPESYTVSGEPMNVTLHTDYLDTLSAGEHKIMIVTANGEASAGFTVTDDGELPKTGVGGKNPLWIASLIMCSGLVVIAVSTRTERRKDNK